ncbi:MAG: helix-turn-helix domain-containing protein [Dysgonomonas sp.]
MDSIIVLKKEELRTLIRSEVELAVANVMADNKAQKKTAPKYLTRNEAANELRVSLSSLHRLVATGQLPCIKIGRKSVFRDKDIQQVGITLNR